MTFRDHRILGAVGGVLGGLSLLAFVVLVIFKVWTGHYLETYYSGTLVQWTYGSALITIVLLAIAIVLAGLARSIYRYRTRHRGGEPPQREIVG